ncbi:Large subunit GTPase 1 [Dictyocoela roeselum]|nr:Large subunit GTPase 1 [Dictyocoela roeselum]
MKEKTKKFSNPLTQKLYQQSFKPKSKKRLESEVIPKSIDIALENFDIEVDTYLDAALQNIKLYTPIPPRVRFDYARNELIVNYTTRIPIENMKTLGFYEKYIFNKWKREGLYERNYEFWRQFFLTCEMSEAIFHVADCRTMLIEPFVCELYANKRHFLVLNKIDLLEEKVVAEKIKRCRDAFPFFQNILVFSSADKSFIGDILNVIRKYKAVGIIGYPNVGKSSFINTIFGKKRVGVSQTPGKTKNLQTLRFGKTTIIDCPGLVFARHNKEVLLKNGVLNIDQLKFDFDGDIFKHKTDLKKKFLRGL